MRRFLLVFAFVFFGLAHAQEAGGVLETVLNIDTWVQELSTYTDVYGEAFERIAYALVAVGFVASLIGVLSRGSLGAMNDTFFRLFLATGLLALSPSITTLSVDTWRGLRDWSGGEMQQSFQDGAVEMEQLGNDAGILAIAATGSASSLLRVSGMGAAQAAGQARAGTAVKMLNAMVIPVAMIGLIANFIILGSGIAIFIACAFLPISAGMLAFSPMQGGEWLGRVVGAVVSALAVTAFMPLIFKAAFDITVVQPVQAVNAEFAELEDYYNPNMLTPPPRLAEIESERQTLTAEKGELQAGLKKWNIVANLGPATRIGEINGRLAALAAEATVVRATWMARSLDNLNNAYDAIANQVTRWGVRLLIMLFGAFMATGLTWWGARAATGLVGGVVGGKIGTLAAGGLSGLFGGGGSRAGGGGNKGLGNAQGGSGGGNGQTPASGGTGTKGAGTGPSSGGGRNEISEGPVDVASRRIHDLPSGNRPALGRGSPKALPSGD